MPDVVAKAAVENGRGDVKTPWRSYLRQKGLKTTQQREAIVDAFLRSSGHVALDDLLERARRTHPGVGLATVYRTVKLLEEAGLAASRQFQSGHTLYEVAQGRAHHDHLICQQCGYIVEFESEKKRRLKTTPRPPREVPPSSPPPAVWSVRFEKAQGLPDGQCPAEAAARKPSR